MSNRINLLEPEIRKNPYPIYARMRRHSPVCQVEPGGLWAVTRYRDVQYVLKHPAQFASAGFRALLEPPWLPSNPMATSILALDPPQHGKLRALVSRAFTSSSISSMTEQVRHIADELVSGLLARAEVDIAAELATLLPARIIAQLLGLDAALYRSFQRWADDLAGITPEQPEDARTAEIAASIREMQQYFTAVIDERRRQPTGDMVSTLVSAEVDGKRLTDHEILSFLFLLLPAGFETTRNLLANAVLGFIERPADMAMLRAQPERIPRYVDELLRHDPPVHGVLRIATEDVDIAGVTIPRSSMVLVLLGSANRDEEHYPDPDRFDPDRDGDQNVAFGHGIHFCLGAALARMETAIALELLCARVARIERLPGELAWSRTLTVRGPLELPVRCVGMDS